MPSHIKIRDLAKISALTAFSIFLYSAENLIPKPLPYLRIGLSNAFILCILYLYDLKTGIIVSLLRTALGLFLTGLLFSPNLMFGLAGGLSSTFFMWLFIRFFGNFFSFIGISIIGAVFHNLSQILVARFIFIKSDAIFSLLPFLILWGCGTGAVTGIFAGLILNAIKKVEKSL